MSLWTAAGAGVVAGLGVAVPLGAIGMLLVREGLQSWRRASAGAAAVATVDGLYAAAAVMLGPVIADPLRQVQAWVRLAAAAVLVGVAARGLMSLRQERPDPAGAATGQDTGLWRAYLRFGALTAINPTTALYFTALTAAQAGALGTAATATVFVVGVFAASLLWQQLLAAAGAVTGARLPARAWLATHAVGYGLVVCYAVLLAWPLP